MDDVAIIGLRLSGKTTVFRAVTGREPPPAGPSEPHVAVVKVPDQRLDRLSALFRPKKTTPAELRYRDFPAAGAGFGKGEGPAAAFIAELRQADGLIHVVRAFDSPAAPHPEGSIDPARDVATLDLELTLADLAVVERRIERLHAEARSMRAGQRGAAERELALFQKLVETLQAERPLRALALDEDELRALSGYGLLTLKPMLLLLNIGETDVPRADALASELQSRLADGREVAAFCAQLEAELAELAPEEAVEYRSSLGLPEERGLERAVHLSYRMLGRISFFTVGDDECRAWTVRAGVTAPEAAGVIHSDLQRGFIRAEVIRWDQLLELGGYAEARKRGLVRSEGKAYVAHDGDVLHVLFSV